MLAYLVPNFLSKNNIWYELGSYHNIFSIMPFRTIFTNCNQEIATIGNIGIGTTIVGAIVDVFTNSSTTALRVNQKGAGDILNARVNGNVSILVDTVGNVGIGTSIVKKTLDITGDINFTGSLYKNSVLDTATYQWTNSGTSIYYASGNVGIGTTLPNALLHVGVGTTTVSPIMLTSGTSLTTPVIGAIEFDGNAIYSTNNTTSGRAEAPIYHGYVYTSDGSALGPTIADYFGANTSLNLEAGSYYEIEAMCYFTKQTSGNVTWTWVFSSAVSMVRSYWISTVAGGFTTTISTTPGATGTAAQLTTTSLAHLATGSITNTNSAHYIFKVHLVTNLATDIRLRVTNSAGTVTPKAGSYYKIKKVLVSNGKFSA